MATKDLEMEVDGNNANSNSNNNNNNSNNNNSNNNTNQISGRKEKKKKKKMASVSVCVCLFFFYHRNCGSLNPGRVDVAPHGSRRRRRDAATLEGGGRGLLPCVCVCVWVCTKWMCLFNESLNPLPLPLGRRKRWPPPDDADDAWLPTSTICRAPQRTPTPTPRRTNAASYCWLLIEFDRAYPIPPHPLPPFSVSLRARVCVCVCVSGCVSVCVSGCVSVCVCVCVALIYKPRTSRWLFDPDGPCPIDSDLVFWFHGCQISFIFVWWHLLHGCHISYFLFDGSCWFRFFFSFFFWCWWWWWGARSFC